MHTDVCAAPGPPGAALAFRPWGFGAATVGNRRYMSDDTDRIEQRAADLLPEERSVGSADPEAQAAAILAESDEREADLEAAPDSFLEHRTSDQTADTDGSAR